MGNFLIFLSWELLIFTITLLFLPISIGVLNTKSIYTWVFSKIGGLLFFTYIIWILQLLGLLNFIQIIFITTFLIILVNLYIGIKNQKTITEFIKNKLVKISIFEIGFTLSSLIYLVYRGINPKVEGIEKFMDQAILNSLIKTDTVPPVDVWYSQTNLQYYYFGQYIFAVISRILSTPLELNYNLAISYSFALAITTTIAVIILVIKNKYVALLGSIVVLLAGNLDYIYKTIFLKKPDYFFAEARSLIEFAITEFPAYSYILGDLHAHLLNIPFAVFYIGLSYFYFVNKKPTQYFHIAIGAFLGILFMINSWDYIIYSLLTGIVFLYKIIKHKDIKNQIVNLLYTVVTSIIVLLPFKLNFNAAVTGIGVNNKFSGFLPLFLMFGHFVIIFTVFLILVKIFKLKIKQKEDLTFINILFITGVFLVILAEIFFIKDIYFTANPPYFRANTVFKVWYQAYIFFGISSVYYIYNLIKSRKYPVKVIAVIFLIVFSYNIMYTYNGVKYYFNSTLKEQRGISGIKFLDSNGLSEEKKAIEFMNKNVKQQVIILEKPGDSYTTDNLFSVFTGNPTPVGWINHEFGWQGKWDPIAKTLGDIELIYTSTDETQVKNLIKKYKIEYVIVSSKEKTKYGESAAETVSKLSKVCYQNNGVKIYRID